MAATTLGATTPCSSTTVGVAGLRDGPCDDRVEQRLFALMDGLAVHAALRPEALSADAMRTVLDAHLEQLAQR